MPTLLNAHTQDYAILIAEETTKHSAKCIMQTYHSIPEHHIYNIQIKCKPNTAAQSAGPASALHVHRDAATSHQILRTKIVFYKYYIKMHDYAMTVGLESENVR